MSNMLKKIALLLLCSFSLTATAAACGPQPKPGDKPATTKAAAKSSKAADKAKSKSTVAKVRAAQAKADKEIAALAQEAEKKNAEAEKKEREVVEAPSGDPMEAIRAFIAEQPLDKTQTNWRQAVVMPPKLTFPADKKYFWNLDTSEGPIKIELMTKVAPMHVSSTIYLTELGFYDGLIFHRVIQGFMAQGGCPLGKGYGGPAYKYRGEFDPKVKHDRPGLLSMANTGQDGTDGSQFFLTFSPQPGLNGKHTIFGEVVDGMETARAIEKKGTRGEGTPKNMWIKAATISVEDAPPPAETTEPPKAE